MSKGSVFFSFVTGAVIGAAAIFLTMTKQGEELVQEGKKAFDKYSSDLKDKFNSYCEKPENTEVTSDK